MPAIFHILQKKRGTGLIPTFSFNRTLSSDTFPLVNAGTISEDGQTLFSASFELQSDEVSIISTVSIFKRSGSNWNLQQVIRASDARASVPGVTPSDQFGNAIALSSDGTIAVIGSNRTGAGTNSSGAVFIFTLTGGVWTEIQKIVGTDRQRMDYFGMSVDVSADGNIIIIGEPNEDEFRYGIDDSFTYDGDLDRGSVYIYERNGAEWAYRTRIYGNPRIDSAYFGSWVSISSSGQRAIIAARGEYGGFNRKGVIYVFDLPTPSSAQMQTKLNPSTVTVSSSLLAAQVISLSGDGNTFVSSAQYDDEAGTDAGAANIFTFNGTSWTQQRLIADDASAYDNFGGFVAISTDGLTVAVSSTFNRPEGDGVITGAVYIFKYMDSIWTQTQKILAPDRQYNGSERFGDYVTINANGSTVVVHEQSMKQKYIFDI